MTYYVSPAGGAISVASFWRRILLIPIVTICVGTLAVTAARAQSDGEAQPPADASVTGVPQRVDVDPAANDAEIADRLNRILTATRWFEQPEVRVDQGVVFLSGQTADDQHRQWAGRLAGNTEAVVAVVNDIRVSERSMWDLSPAWDQLERVGVDAVRSSPLIVIGLLLLVATWFASKWSVRATAMVLHRQLKSQLLRDVLARAIAVPVFLLGLYVVLKVSGLTGLAVTVIGGTGLIGLVIGFAFRDIAENFLSSILISMQRPFATGDLVEVAGYKGFVQSVNTRSTLLMTLEGNHVQIPNATIYKETITNFTANPNARFDFAVGIGYEDSVSEAQAAALAVLRDHPAVVEEPEPLVLVETLGAATVNLRVYFWVDIAKYSSFKVQSAVIRLTKRAFQQAGISMPDEAREVVFPAGVPVRMLPDAPTETSQRDEPPTAPPESEAIVNSAEGDLASEAEEIQVQATQSRQLEGDTNLLENG